MGQRVPTPSAMKGPLLVPAPGLLGWISASFLQLGTLIELREALRCSMGDLFLSSAELGAGLQAGGWRREGPPHLPRWGQGLGFFFGAQTPLSLFLSHLLPAKPPEMPSSHGCRNYLQLLPREKGLYLLKRGEMKVGLQAWGGGVMGREVAFQPRN